MSVADFVKGTRSRSQPVDSTVETFIKSINGNLGDADRLIKAAGNRGNTTNHPSHSGGWKGVAGGTHEASPFQRKRAGFSGEKPL